MMRHPIEKYNQIQAEELAKLAQEQRKGKALMYRISNAAYCYQFQFNDVAGLSGSQVANAPEDLLDWLERQLSTRAKNQSASELLSIRLYMDRILTTVKLCQYHTKAMSSTMTLEH